MDIGLMHVTPYSKADPAIVASHAEKLGFESYWVGDHTIVPSNRVFPIPARNMTVVNHTMCHNYPTL